MTRESRAPRARGGVGVLSRSALRPVPYEECYGTARKRTVAAVEFGYSRSQLLPHGVDDTGV